MSRGVGAVNTTNATTEGASTPTLWSAAVSCLESLDALDITTRAIGDYAITGKFGNEGASVATLRWLDVKDIDAEQSSCRAADSYENKILHWAASSLHDVAATYSIMATGVRTMHTHTQAFELHIPCRVSDTGFLPCTTYFVVQVKGLAICLR